MGDTVFTLGFPDPDATGLRCPSCPKVDIASLFWRGMDELRAIFRISVLVQPEQLGGALMDERGNVIGIVSAKLDESVALASRVGRCYAENVNVCGQEQSSW